MSDVIIDLKEPQLKARVDAFRTDFVKNHFQPRIPYPLIRAFSDMNMNPIDPSAERIVRWRGLLTFSGMKLLNRGLNLDVPCRFDLAAQEIDINVLVPTVMVVEVSSTSSSLAFKYLSPLGVTFVYRPYWGQIQIRQLPEFVLLKRMTLSATAFEFEMSSTSGASSDSWTLRLHLV